MFRSTTAVFCLLAVSAFSLTSARSPLAAPAPTGGATSPAVLAASIVGTAKVATPRRDLPASRLLNRRTLLSRRAMGFRQARYRFGAASPHATDCSGMTMQLYRTVGIKLPHSARAQYHYGKAVAKKDLLPGDLCFFNTRGGISHVGMYIGDGKMIHAANPRKGVRIDPLSTSYYARRFVGARRLLPEGAPMPVLPPVTDTTPGIEIPEGEMLATATGSARVLGN